MPFIALNSDNEEVTASYCRDEFLHTEVVRSGFKCAFCFCPYFARYVYVDGKIGRAPHFYVTSEKHRGGCDGTPLDVKPDAPSKLQGKRIPESEFSFPEKLVARPKPRVVAVPTGTSPLDVSEEDITRRRRQAGREYGSSAFTSSLLQVIVESKNKIASWCYDEIAAKKLNKKEASELFKATAGSYPLQLFDQKGLTYDSAFWSANYERTGPGERIFHAKRGFVALTASRFTIRSEAPSTESSTTKPNNKALPVEVRYEGEYYESGKAPLAHTKAMLALAKLTSSDTVQWYAYGRMVRDGDKLIISLKTLDHFHWKE